jgi:hypothetical protein
VMVENEISLQFNNVMYDTLPNAVFENISMKKGNGSRAVVFNNTADCGPSWSLTFGCVSPFDRSGDIYQNNLFITSSETPNQACPAYGGFSTCTTGKEMTPGAAAKKGYKAAQDYAYSPTSSHSPTVGKGTSLATICKVAARVTAAAGAACLKDTTYGVAYNSITHTVTGPSRIPIARPATPDIGAYQFSESSEPAPSHP